MFCGYVARSREEGWGYGDMACCAVLAIRRVKGRWDKLVDENRNSRRLPGLRVVFIHRRQIQGAPNIVGRYFGSSPEALEPFFFFWNATVPDRLVPPDLGP